MAIFGVDEEETIDPRTGMPFAQNIQMPDAPEAPEMNPTVKEHLMKKLKLGKYSNESREALVQDSGLSFGDRTGAALQAIGAGFMGRDPASASAAALSRAGAERDKRLQNFDKGRANEIQEYSLGRELEKDSRDDDARLRESDPNSEESKIANELAQRMGYKGPPLTAERFKAFAPPLQKMFEIEQQKLKDQEQRSFQRETMSANRQDRLAMRSDKQKELSSTQAKQRGLYDIGKAAEDQYAKATSTAEYDPTGVGQVIDNSSWAPNLLKNNKAIEAQAARSSWIESFLRDASGAAIPEAERGAYADIYFPQPGDPKDVVANKAALRSQKMQSSRVAAGYETGHGPREEGGGKKTIVKTQTNQKTGEKRIVYSDGTSEVVSGQIAGR